MCKLWDLHIVIKRQFFKHLYSYIKQQPKQHTKYKICKKIQTIKHTHKNPRTQKRYTEYQPNYQMANQCQRHVTHKNQCNSESETNILYDYNLVQYSVTYGHNTGLRSVNMISVSNGRKHVTFTRAYD